MTTQNALNTQLVLPSGSTAISKLLYTSAANVVSGLTTGNNGILVTSNTGVPSIATTFGQGLAVASSVLSVGAANNIPFNTGKGIQDNNGNSLLLFTVVGSAVNYWNMSNDSTTAPPILSAAGSDTNISGIISSKGLGNINIYGNSLGTLIASFAPVTSGVNYINFVAATTGTNPLIQGVGTDPNVTLKLAGQGTSGVQIQGVTDASNAGVGFVGELISSVIALGSAVNIVNVTPTNMTSISLTAGDWDIFGNVNFIQATSTLQNAICWISSSSATFPDASLYNGFVTTPSVMTAFGTNAPYFRASISTTTTIYISGYVLLVSGTCAMCGGIYARRIR